MTRAARTSLGYIAFGVAWILLSDPLLAAVAVDADSLARAGLVKGLLFVVISGGLLYLAARQSPGLRSLRLLEAICKESNDAIFATDAEGRVLFINEAMGRIVGQPHETLLHRDAATSFPPAFAARVREWHAEVMVHGRVLRRETTLATLEGERHFLDTLGPLHDAQGSVTGMFCVSRDITERRRQEDTHRQWAMAFENTRDGVLITDPRGCIVTVNRAFTDITGYARDEVIARTPAMLRSGQHGLAFYNKLWRSLNESGIWQGEIWNRRKNGEVYPEWLTISAVRDEAGVLVNYVAVFTDITRLKHSEAEIARLAQYDPLTGLPNRLLLHDRLGHALERRRRHGGRVAVLYIDLDGFKTVNDSLGHPAGDELLQRMAGRLRARLRDEDTLGRLGGDEFLVLLESVSDPAEVTVAAERLLQAVAEPVRLSSGHEVYVTASIGVALYPDDCSACDAVEMLRDADAAMYRAKDEGRNRFCFYTRDLHAQAVAKLDLEAALSRALERNELRLHYQPKVDAHTGELTGVEGLLRWQRNGTDLVQPGQFIPLAERSSLMLDIGGWVIDEACRQMRAWLDAGLAVPNVAINVAARQFAAGNLDAVVDQALRRHGLPPGRLQLELTESMLIERPQETEAMLRQLKALGVSIALDDFGTGYSNLAYLQRFPIDTLKIDQSFVRRIGEQPDGAALVDAIIALAHRLHLKVVAEGVESASQREHLRVQGCDELQGFHFSRPLAVEQLESLVADPGWAVAAVAPEPSRARPSLARV
jgi:diguanylate cyclase (GGDEF)-like protein/PAS domain S-box-containing protein